LLPRATTGSTRIASQVDERYFPFFVCLVTIPLCSKKGNTWNTPTTVSNAVTQLWSGAAVSPDGTQLLLVGGDSGAQGTNNVAWVWNLSAFFPKPHTPQILTHLSLSAATPPQYQQLPAPLPYLSERSAVAITDDGNAYVYSGAVYSSSSAATASSYNLGVLALLPNTVGRRFYYCSVCCYNSVLIHIPYILFSRWHTKW